jgi:hypothetical protein
MGRIQGAGQTSVPAVEICCEMSAAGMMTSASETL